MANTLWGPGLDGMGGAAKEAAGMGIRGGPGVGPLTAGGRPGGCTLDTGRRCGVGLWVPELWIQVSSTGGGTGVDTVLVLMSPMMLSASLSAWYMRSMSSRRCAWSADSSMRLLWSAEEYR